MRGTAATPLCANVTWNTPAFWNLQSKAVSLMAAVLDSSMNPDPSTPSPGIPDGARRANGGMPGAAARPHPEIVAVARRRQFSVGQKRALLAEANRCKAAGTLGAFLRSRRIYSSMLSSWRKQIEAADQIALAPKKRGPKPDPSARQLQQLSRENARVRHNLDRAELIIKAQKGRLYPDFTMTFRGINLLILQSESRCAVRA